MTLTVWTVLYLLLQGLGILTAAHALLNKDQPAPALGWVAFSLMLPGVGAAAYWMFGVNRIRTRARKLQHPARTGGEPTHPPGTAVAGHPGAHYSELDRTTAAVTGNLLLRGNRVTPLHNGDETYPEMIAAIDAAEHAVYLSTYIFDLDRTGRRFLEALGAAHDRGVAVRVLTDGIGELYSRPRITPALRRRGLTAERFLPPGLNRPIHINLRNHRKILTVDGRLGFTGGMNISDRHVSPGEGQPPKAIDVHFRIEGPVVPQLETAFLNDWNFTTGEVIEPGDPEQVDVVGPCLCRAISDGPDKDFEKFEWVFIGAVNAARHHVRIMTPYFLPGPELSSALNAAALRGVQVDVVLPAKNNLPFVAWATQSMLWQLVEHGVRVHFHPPPFVHSKLFLVDREYAQIGSANLDPRSLKLNFEFNLEIYGPDLVADLAEHFDRARDDSRQVTLDELHGRSLPVKLRDAAFWIFSPYL